MSGSDLSGIKAMPRIQNAFIEIDLFNADSFHRLNLIQLFHKIVQNFTIGGQKSTHLFEYKRSEF
jgi:hypothetical protein